MQFRIRFAQQVVGIFIILAGIMLAGTLIFMGINQRLFSRNYSYRTEFKTAEGLSLGMSIRLRGFEIGKVGSITLNENNRVDVELSIYDTYLDKVKPNSVLELVTSPIGLGASLNFFPGNNVDESLTEGAFIPSSDTPLGKAIVQQGLVDKPEGDEAISKILAEIQPLLVEVRGVTTELNTLLAQVNADLAEPNSRNVDGVMGDVFRIIRNFETLTGSISSIMNEVNGRTASIMEDINAITTDFTATSEGLRDPTGIIPKLLDPKGSLATFLDDNNVLFNQVREIIAELNNAATEVTKFTQYVNRQTPTISGLMEETRTTLRQTQDVLTGLANNPLLKGGIPEQAPQRDTFRSTRDENY